MPAHETGVILWKDYHARRPTALEDGSVREDVALPVLPKEENNPIIVKIHGQPFFQERLKRLIVEITTE